MNIITLDHSDYIGVRLSKDDSRVSFGGSQNWALNYPNRKYFNDSVSSKELKQCGCGLVALTDVILYFLGKYTVTFNQYINYLQEVSNYTTFLKFPVKTLTPNAMKVFFKGYNCKWICFNTPRRFLKLAKSMLLQDVPVIFSFYTMDKKQYLPLYSDIKLSHSTHRVTAHYMVITSIIECDHQTILEVSSWGKKYYIDFKEYAKKLVFPNTLFCDLLYIEKILEFK